MACDHGVASILEGVADSDAWGLLTHTTLRPHCFLDALKRCVRVVMECRNSALDVVAGDLAGTIAIADGQQRPAECRELAVHRRASVLGIDKRHV